MSNDWTCLGENWQCRLKTQSLMVSALSAYDLTNFTKTAYCPPIIKCMTWGCLKQVKWNFLVVSCSRLWIVSKILVQLVLALQNSIKPSAGVAHVDLNIMCALFRRLNWIDLPGKTLASVVRFPWWTKSFCYISHLWTLGSGSQGSTLKALHWRVSHKTEGEWQKNITCTCRRQSGEASDQ